MVKTTSEIKIIASEAPQKKIKNGFAVGKVSWKLIWIFLIGCLFGAIYESLLCLGRNGYWETRRGMVWGPFNPIYGGGAVLFIALLHKKNFWWVLIYGIMIGVGLEFLIGFLESAFIGVSSWDYTHLPLQIFGRVTLPIAFMWGGLSVLVVKIIYPLFSMGIEKMNQRVGKILSIALLIFFALNFAVTTCALFRMTSRNEGRPAYGPVAKLMDLWFDNATMRRLFPNMYRDTYNPDGTPITPNASNTSTQVSYYDCEVNIEDYRATLTYKTETVAFCKN